MQRCQRLIWCALAFSVVSIVSGFGRRPEPTGDIVAVEAYPETIVLTGRHSYAQLVLTGFRDDGMKVDMTRDAVLAAPCPLVEIDERGLVRPRRDGEGELRFEIGELEVSVPVRVSGQAAAFRPSFVQDVMPILAKRGCNAGTCHGSAKGKNGFKLSLRGYDAAFDYTALTDDLAGRRFDRAAPDKSLFLLKPTASVPHEGGLQVAPDEPDYDVLRAWVADGVELDLDAPRVVSIDLFPENPTVPEPGMSQQFAVLATFADGTVRDVTAHAFVETADIEIAEVDGDGLVRTLRRGDAAILARYEGRYASTRMFVMGDRKGFEWRDFPEYNFIDSLVYSRLQRIKTLPSEVCTDAEFLRRVYLDLTGLPPSRKQVETFLQDERDARLKRDELVERLIGSPEFVDHWTNRWADLLEVNSKFLGAEGARAFRTWIRKSVASDVPYDDFVRQLLTGTGSTLENPAAAYYKVLREPGEVMEHTTQLFLGVRFSCNKCHDHPFERWTQRQHWQLAGFFAQVKREDAPGSKKMPKSTVMKPGESPPAYEEIISDADEGTAEDPNGVSYTASLPYEHDGQRDAVLEEGAPLREQVAQWLVAAENPYFAKSYVNRVWSYFLGVGLIDPVDDIRASNPPTNPELLERLTADFIESGFDVRHLMRVICSSRVYQHSIRTNEWNQDDAVNFSHALARRLPAETLYDAVHLATGSRPRLPGVREGTLATELVGPSVKSTDGFLDLFGRPPRESACECERTSGISLGQALNLVNGPTLAEAIDDPDNEISRLVAFERDPRKVVEELYLTFLCRMPTAEELDALVPTFAVDDPANASALSAKDRAALDGRLAKWEASRPVAEWRPVEPGHLESKGGAELVVQPDGSILVGGPIPDKDSYTVVAWTDVSGITGVRLEALPDDSLGGKGPGRAQNGNFVLQSLALTAVPVGDATAAKPVVLQNPTADFSQNGYPVASAIAEGGKGWAVSPQLGRRHVAVFETRDDVGAAGGTLLIFELNQPYGSMHTLGRFRLSVTSSKRPVRHHGLPDAVAAILRVPADQRTDAQKAAIYRHYIRTDAEMSGRIRLGAAQDLAWALANSPAFLFNR